MKRIILLFSAALMGLATLSLASCDLSDENSDLKSEWVDNGNTATATFKVSEDGQRVTTVYTIVFDDSNVCTGCSVKITCSSAIVADSTWDEVKDMPNANRSGNTITYNDDTFVGLRRSAIKAFMQALPDWVN